MVSCVNFLALCHLFSYVSFTDFSQGTPDKRKTEMELNELEHSNPISRDEKSPELSSSFQGEYRNDEKKDSKTYSVISGEGLPSSGASEKEDMSKESFEVNPFFPTEKNSPENRRSIDALEVKIEAPKQTNNSDQTYSQRMISERKNESPNQQVEILNSPCSTPVRGRKRKRSLETICTELREKVFLQERMGYADVNRKKSEEEVQSSIKTEDKESETIPHSNEEILSSADTDPFSRPMHLNSAKSISSFFGFYTIVSRLNGTHLLGEEIIYQKIHQKIKFHYNSDNFFDHSFLIFFCFSNVYESFIPGKFTKSQKWKEVFKRESEEFLEKLEKYKALPGKREIILDGSFQILILKIGKRRVEDYGCLKTIKEAFSWLFDKDQNFTMEKDLVPIWERFKKNTSQGNDNVHWNNVELVSLYSFKYSGIAKSKVFSKTRGFRNNAIDVEFETLSLDPKIEKVCEGTQRINWVELSFLNVPFHLCRNCLNAKFCRSSVKPSLTFSDD